MNSELNFILELVDGTVLITAFGAAVFISIYILDCYRASHRKLIAFLCSAPIGARLAMSMLGVKVGAVLLVGGLLASRFQNQKINAVELSVVCVGILMLVMAMLWITRVLTQPVHGEWPWVTTTLATILYMATMMLGHFHGRI